MKTTFKITALLSIILSTIIFSCDSVTGSKSMPVYKEKVTIIFFSGDVVKKTEDGDKTIEIGEKLTAGDYIKTSKNSFCELMVGNKASIRIDENTEFAIKSVMQKEKTDVQFDLVQGSLMTKIKKFTDVDNEEFTVFSKSVACSVRGTAFKMTSLPGEKFDLQVAEGSVSVKPVSYALETALRKNLADDFTENASSQLGAGEILVPEGKALELGQDQVIALETQVALLSQALINKKSANAKSEEITVALTAIKGIELVQRDLSEKDNKELKPLQTLGGDFFEKDLEKIELKRVSLSTVPNNAYIFRDDVMIGQGAFSAIFEKGTKLKFLIKASGYKQQEVEITVGTNSENVSVKLEDQPIVKIPFALKVAPADADIIINEENAQKGPINSELNEGEEYIISISKPGYETRILSFIMSQADSVKIISLTPKVIRHTKISSGAIVKSMPVIADGLICADTYGSVRLFGADSLVKWTVNSSNVSDNLHYPIIAGGFVYYSGANEWVQVNIGTGTYVSKKLTGDDKHLFIRSNCDPVSQTLIMPYKSKADLYSISGTLIKTMDYGFLSSATPGLWGTNLVLTDTDGAFHIVGDKKKTIPTDSVHAVGTSIVVFGNVAYYGNNDGMAIAINLIDGNIKWKVPIASGSPIFSDPLLLPNLNSILFYLNNSLVALSLTDGKIVYTLQGVMTPPAYRDGKLYYGATGNTLRMVPLIGGLEGVTVSLGKTPTTAPAFMAGKVYIGTQEGIIQTISNF